MGVAALVLGILGMVSAVTVFLAPIGFVLVVVGLILGIVDTVKKGKTGEKKGVSIAGVVICAIFFVVLIVENFIMMLGLAIYEATSNGILDNAQRVQDAELFNATYEPYVGIKTGSTVRTLLSRVSSNNMINKQNTISCRLDGMLGEPDTLAPRVSTVKQYDVTLIYDADQYVCQINITSIGGMELD